MTIREATSIIKTMTEALDSEFGKLESVREAAEDSGDDMLNWLEPDEVEALAIRASAREGSSFQRDKHKRLRLVDPIQEIPPATIVQDNDAIEAEIMEES